MCPREWAKATYDPVIEKGTAFLGFAVTTGFGDVV